METFKEMDDALLAERIGCDDRSAFDELYNRHRKRTFGFIRARVYNDADAHDIAQDAWGRIWQQRRAYEAERGDFGAFAMRLTISAVADYYRARRTRQERELLFSEVLARFPEFAQDGDVEEALRRLRTFPNERGVKPKEGGLMYPRYEVYQELLHRVFGDANPPHQSLAAGFCKLLEWKPREIVVEPYSHLSLADLEECFEKELGHRLPRHQLRPCLEAFCGRLQRKVREVVGERKTRETYAHLLERVSGSTTLQDYFTADPEADVSHWWYAVKRRVWSEVHREGKGLLFDWIQGEDRRRAARNA